MAPAAARVPTPANAKTILSSADLQRVVDRIAHQILEKTHGAADTVLLGIPTRGFRWPVASLIAFTRSSRCGYRWARSTSPCTDDLRTQAPRALGPTTLPPVDR